jgi:hypothetical protein
MVCDLRFLSYVFTSKVLKELLSFGKTTTGAEVLENVGFYPTFGQSLSEFFDSCYNILKSIRPEYVYRNGIAEEFLLRRHSLETAGMLQELRAGASRADVVIINGETTVYEIKSEFDSLKRINQQILDYTSIFDKVYVVVHPTHVNQIEKKIPNQCGIIVLDQKYHFTEVRQALSNPESLKKDAMFESLRRSEYLEILSRVANKSFEHVPNGYVHQVAKSEFTVLDLDSIRSEFTRVLRSRAQTKVSNYFMGIPSALRALFLASDFNVREQEALLATLGKPASDCFAFGQ